MKNEELAEMLRNAPIRRTDPSLVTTRLIEALEELKTQDVSLQQISKASGISSQTVYYRVREKWKIKPSRHLAKIFKGESDLYCREEILKKARGE